MNNASLPDDHFPGAPIPTSPEALGELLEEVERQHRIHENHWQRIIDGRLLMVRLETRIRELQTALYELVAAPAQRPRDEKHGKKPSKDAIETFRASTLLGKSQDELRAMFGVNQSTISRRLAQVQRWLDAGNILPPELATPPSRPKIVPMDPRKMERRPRGRGRA
jgi:hypothetical protein